ncbi:hypothetical protein ABKA04_007650 [Annulohypoxylon sp. FPYF3050]
MENWESQPTTTTPQVKFEASPAESLMSVPGDMYPSLFATSSSVNTLESVMTPQSFTEEKSASTEPTPSPAPENAEKKPAKKRKSWGQVLPEPKTNLPPRKRAKTEDEKEQRRVERVLRNRRAAQSSRERKRQEVEALEQRNQQLEELLRNQQKTNELLMDELNKLRGNGGSRSSSPLDAFQPSPLTLSQPLFGASQDGQAEDKPGMMNDFILMPEQDGTVDPASLSPELTPVADDNLGESSKAEKTATAPTSEPTSTDATQHPAAVFLATTVASSAVTLPAASNAADSLFSDAFSLSTPFDVDSWGAEGQFSPSSDPLNFEYNNLAGNSTPQFPEFDFDQFLSTDDVSGAAPGATAGSDSVAQDNSEPSFSLFDSENQISSEALNQQPHLGASTQGCDDGVIAVGV